MKKRACLLPNFVGKKKYMTKDNWLIKKSIKLKIEPK